MVERDNGIVEVRGSTPLLSTIQETPVVRGRGFSFSGVSFRHEPGPQRALVSSFPVTTSVRCGMDRMNATTALADMRASAP